jgi:hypothetical protein
MSTLRVHDLLPKRALVTRESAEPIRRALVSADLDAASEIVLDFSGIDAVTPSFVDEVLSALDKSFRRAKHDRFRLLLLNPPTRLSSKFAAVARGRDLDISETEGGAWVVTRGPTTVPS